MLCSESLRLSVSLRILTVCYDLRLDESTLLFMVMHVTVKDGQSSRKDPGPRRGQSTRLSLFVNREMYQCTVSEHISSGGVGSSVVQTTVYSTHMIATCTAVPKVIMLRG